MKDLLDLYFHHIAIVFPIIHRPTFEKSFYGLLHLSRYDFGCVVLSMCAIGARYSNDPRVLADEDSEHQLGWKYFKQIKPLMTITPPSLYDLQLYSVSAT
jgi:hypothetical protein